MFLDHRCSSACTDSRNVPQVYLGDHPSAQTGTPSPAEVWVDTSLAELTFLAVYRVPISQWRTAIATSIRSLLLLSSAHAPAHCTSWCHFQFSFSLFSRSGCDLLVGYRISGPLHEEPGPAASSERPNRCRISSCSATGFYWTTDYRLANM